VRRLGKLLYVKQDWLLEGSDRLVVVRRFANRCAPFERSGFAGAVTSKCSVMNGAWMVTEPAISRFVAQATNDGAGFNASVALPHSELLVVRRGDVVVGLLGFYSGVDWCVTSTCRYHGWLAMVVTWLILPVVICSS